MNKNSCNLGIHIANISAEIERLKCSGYVSIPILLLMEDILNCIRLQSMKYIIQKKESFKIIIDCSSDKVDEIFKILNENLINYEVEKTIED